jgi:uncharacterized protein with PIN domain
MRAREGRERQPGACRESAAAFIEQTSALLRRRTSEDMLAVANLIRDAAHCVPCIAVVTHLDARRIYTALEQLKAEANVRLVFDRCPRCSRTTTAHMIAS